MHSSRMRTVHYSGRHWGLPAGVSPGFPRGGARILQEACQHTIFSKISKKLHEIEKILDHRGRAPDATLLDLPLGGGVCIRGDAGLHPGRGLLLRGSASRRVCIQRWEVGLPRGVSASGVGRVSAKGVYNPL